MNIKIFSFLSLCIALALAGCSRSGGPAGLPSPTPRSESVSAEISVDPQPTHTPFACPVTLPKRETPPGEKEMENLYGNGELWVALWPEGKVLASEEDVRADGSIDMKFPWWRSVTGKLAIQGRRLDGEGAPLAATIPEGYGETGFQSTGLHFPIEGCWEVTGQAGAASLTFVTLVITEP